MKREMIKYSLIFLSGLTLAILVLAQIIFPVAATAIIVSRKHYSWG